MEWVKCSLVEMCQGAFLFIPLCLPSLGSSVLAHFLCCFFFSPSRVASSSTTMEFWIKATLLLCSYGFFKEMKPSEPFLTPYLKAQKNMTEEDLEKIYPVWTYSYLLTLLVVFLVTDLLRYKPVIIIEGLAYLATRILLIWAGGVLAMQFMQFVYGVATGAEVAYYSYIYAVVDRDHYKIVTSYTRAAVLLGRLISGVVGQLLITFKVTDYLVLNYISLGSVSISCVLTLLLPKASGNVFITRTESDYLIEEQRNGCISSWKRTMITMFRDFKLCYSDKELLRWSLWWAFATGGEFQVENYVQNLWEIIYPSHNHKIYNGGVTAISHLTGSLVAIALAHVKINWSIFGELCLGVVSVADAFFLFQSAHTSNIWLAYLMYVLFRTAYTFLITIAR